MDPKANVWERKLSIMSGMEKYLRSTRLSINNEKH